MKRISRLTGLAVAGVLGLSSLATAQTGPSLITQPFEEGSKVEVTFNGQWQGKADAQNGTTDDEIQLQIYDGSARWLLSDDELGLTFGTQITAMSISQITMLPSSLVDHSFALGMNLGAISDWKVSTVLGAGYNGRSPYGDANALYGKADLIFTNKPTDTSMWQVIVDYDGNRSFLPDIPLPSISYTNWDKSDFTWTVGFPYNALTWDISDKLELELRSILLYNIDATLTYEVSDSFELFGAYASRTDAFRADNDNRSTRRVIFSQQTVELGLSYEPCNEFELTVAGGLAFDQEFEYGFDSRDTTSITDVSDEPYLRIAAEIKF
ncbi:MAG TPA: hypothetical protein DCM28_09065 [Phycisphaerales bacterium]|nr:hypothetical protein [Phycisphaerales bacterium]HCD35328.1 hypothetical protein [Phycisphaerales bacterium]|tara:strand:+ start:97 stop:1068 length:972 start_codon:yes stop_codon:yes gene_type:complete